jgi:hypothetical protein
VSFADPFSPTLFKRFHKPYFIAVGFAFSLTFDLSPVSIRLFENLLSDPKVDVLSIWLPLVHFTSIARSTRPFASSSCSDQDHIHRRRLHRRHRLLLDPCHSLLSDSDHVCSFALQITASLALV